MNTMKRIFEVGKMYEVPTVLYAWGGSHRFEFWPVIGPFHEDSEIIGFDWEHYHFDHRFLTDSQYHRLLVRNNPYAAVIHKMENRGDVPRPVIRRRKCRREWSSFPLEKAHWMGRLEDRYESESLKPGLICPHRGGDLSSIAPDASGCVTCPLHGLRWKSDTGELCRQTEGQTEEQKDIVRRFRRITAERRMIKKTGG